MQRMVRAAERAVADAGADADERRRNVRVTDVVLDLLQRAGGEEAGRRNAERLFAARRQPGGDADQVLLRDADFDELLGQRLAERAELARAARIAGDGDDVAVGLGEFQSAWRRIRRGWRGPF